jgi:effector-binding domain-containing protein
MTYEITEKRSAPVTLLRMRRQVRVELIGEDISAGMRELFEQASAAGLRPTGPPAITYLGELGPRPTDVEFTFPVEPGVAGQTGNEVEVVAQPARTVALTRHQGNYDRIGAAHKALEEWIHSSGRRMVGPPTEIYLVGPDTATGPHDLLTEVRIPVATD